eukprot:COSAG02_NODE_1197_length_13932_cov_42.811176_2_plen_66_part_00
MISLDGFMPLDTGEPILVARATLHCVGNLGFNPYARAGTPNGSESVCDTNVGLGNYCSTDELSEI